MSNQEPSSPLGESPHSALVARGGRFSQCRKVRRKTAPHAARGPPTWRSAPTGSLLWLEGPPLSRRIPLSTVRHVWCCPCSLRSAPLSHSERVRCAARGAHDRAQPEDAPLPGPLRVSAFSMAGTLKQGRHASTRQASRRAHPHAAALPGEGRGAYPTTSSCAHAGVGTDRGRRHGRVPPPESMKLAG